MTDAMKFMTIEILLNVDHTYQHDLESFFYVLLWQCSHCGWGSVSNLKGQPTLSLLTNILFPIHDNAIFTGTPKDPEIVYGPIIKAFDMAIDGISAD
ncbi:hypothetical protein GX48_07061 [Paracoccidioides brasiliensis]|nr:hypothetical protein GX48_07061 [Paracoccidioides brasiliensis]